MFRLGWMVEAHVVGSTDGQHATLSESHRRIYRYTIDCRASIYGVKSDHAVIVFNRAMNGLDASTNDRNIRISA